VFAHHVDRIEAMLRETYPPAGGYRTSRKMKTERGRQSWEVEIHRGLLSGARVALRLLPASPHRAEVDVSWHSTLSDILLLLGGLAGLPIAAVVLFGGLYVSGSLLLTGLLLGALIVVWVFVMGIGAHVTARALAAAVGNEFNGDRRASIADGIKALPLETATGGAGVSGSNDRP
jgi:hypothetical protein